MTTLQLNVEKERCTDSCPLPLSVLLNATQGISKAYYDEKSGKVIIEFDEKKISKEKVIAIITTMNQYTPLFFLKQSLITTRFCNDNNQESSVFLCSAQCIKGAKAFRNS